MTKSKTKKFVNFRQLLVFHARLLSEYQSQYSNPGVGISESPQAIYTRVFEPGPDVPLRTHSTAGRLLASSEGAGC